MVLKYNHIPTTSIMGIIMIGKKVVRSIVKNVNIQEIYTFKIVSLYLLNFGKSKRTGEKMNNSKYNDAILPFRSISIQMNKPM